MIDTSHDSSVAVNPVELRRANTIRILVLILASWLVFMNQHNNTPSLIDQGYATKEEVTSPGLYNNNTNKATIVSLLPTSIPANLSTTTDPPSSDANQTNSIFPSSLVDSCRLFPWTANCTEWYNTGNWTILPSPLEWKQIYSQESMDWGTTRFINASECQRIGTSLEWKSNTHDARWDANRFLQVFGPNKRITFVGDSVTRQHYATFLEALGDTILNCSGFDNGWGARSPLVCQTTNNVSIHIVSDNFGSWDEAVGPWEGGIRGKSYNGTMATQDYFRDSDLIIMNFGVWYYEQVGVGKRTNHTSSTYLRHMRTMADDVVLYRQPNQLVVWRETTGPCKPNHYDVKAANLALRSYMAESKIPVIYDHTAMHQEPHPPGSTTVADLYKDFIHFCEPALQMAWTTILFHIVQDWNVGRTP
jgi:hypothetical protein